MITRGGGAGSDGLVVGAGERFLKMAGAAGGGAGRQSQAQAAAAAAAAARKYARGPHHSLISR